MVEAHVEAVHGMSERPVQFSSGEIKPRVLAEAGVEDSTQSFLLLWHI